MAINFVLNNFDTVINLDVSGTMLGELFAAIDASACAEIQIDLTTVKQAFQFQSDSSDVINAAESDVKFYLSEPSFWFSGFENNPVDANVVSGGTTGPIATGFGLDKNMVCHDFVRYIAEKLFNTHHGVDLFDNELELLNDIRDNARAVWDTMQSEINKYKDNGGTGHAGLTLEGPTGFKYSTNAHSESITRRLYEQMIYTAAGRDRFKGGMITGGRQDLPFNDNDTIEIKLTINPESNQHTLVNGVSPLGGRTYKIVYVIKSTPLSITRAADENDLYKVKV